MASKAGTLDREFTATLVKSPADMGATVARVTGR